MPKWIGPPNFAPAKPGNGDRLHSWKEIASYLGRQPRTLRRWEENEGLPVHRLHHNRAGSVYALKSELDRWTAQRTVASPAQQSSKPRWRTGVVIAGVACLLVAAVLWFALSRSSGRAVAATAAPLTGNPGMELEPQLSPDGAQVAYVWDGEAEDNYDIYVRLLAGGTPLRLTTNQAPEYSPAWSPDGKSIAFLRRTGAATAAVVLVPALGGAERRVAEVTQASWPQWGRPGSSLTWSPDGKWLVAAGSQAPEWGSVLMRISPESGEVVPLTTLPSKVMGDGAPAMSPNGGTIAFSRWISWGRSDLCLLTLSDKLLPAGKVRCLDTQSTWNASPAWTPDGSALVFSTGSMDAPYLARIAVSGSAQAERLTAAGEYAWQPTVGRARDGRTALVYTRHFESVNIWLSRLDGSSPPKRLIASPHWSYEPAWSPDGHRVAFLSDRTGHGEIWVADSDGRNAQQWTFLGQPRLGSPRWSPDGRQIAFSAPGVRGSSIYLIDAPGAAPRPVAGTEYCGYLDWSADSRAIYFSSNRGAGTEIWKIAREGGEAARVTLQGGRVPALSSDGRWLYYLKMAGAGGENFLWRMPVQGGNEEKVLEFVDAYSLGDTAIAFKYYRPGPEPVGPSLELFRFDVGKTEHLPQVQRPLRYGIAVSRDGRYLLHSQADYEVSNLMLCDNLRE